MQAILVVICRQPRACRLEKRSAKNRAPKGCRGGGGITARSEERIPLIPLPFTGGLLEAGGVEDGGKGGGH